MNVMQNPANELLIRAGTIWEIAIKVAIGKAERLRFIGSISDGEELVSYLTGKEQYADRQRYPLPDMLLLD